MRVSRVPFLSRMLSNLINFKITLLTKVQDQILNFKFPHHTIILYLTTNQISHIVMTDYIHHFFKKGNSTFERKP